MATRSSVDFEYVPPFAVDVVYRLTFAIDLSVVMLVVVQVFAWSSAAARNRTFCTGIWRISALFLRYYLDGDNIYTKKYTCSGHLNSCESSLSSATRATCCLFGGPRAWIAKHLKETKCLQQ